MVGGTHGRAFLQAAKDGDTGALRELLDTSSAELIEFRGAGTPDGVSGNTAAHWAAARGHIGALEILLKAGAPVGATNHGGSTALQAAVLNGHAKAVRLLRRHGADADAPDEFGDSALDLAQRSQRNQAELLRALIEPVRALAAASPDSPAARLRSEGNAAFAAQQHSRAIELYTAALHEAGGDAEAKGVLWSNVSACHAANADYGRALDAAREATRLRPDWAKAHSRAGAALHGLGQLDEAEAAYLQALQLGDGAATSSAGGGMAGGQGGGGAGVATEGLVAVRRARRMRRLEELIDRGAFDRRKEVGLGPGGREAGGGAEAGLGAAGGGGDIAAMPPSAGTSPKKGKTAEEAAYSGRVRAWMGAAKAGRVAELAAALAAAPWLLTNRSEGTAEKQLGNSALHWAAASGQIEAVCWLLSQPGLDVNTCNQGGGTALHSAAAHGQSAAVEALLAAGASPSLTDSAGDSPAHAAWRRGHRHAEGLIDRGALAPAVRWGGSRPPARPGGWEEAKVAGNAAFTKGSVPCLRRAVWSYTDALLLLPPTGRTEAESPPGKEQPASEEQREQEAVLRSNRSAAHARLCQFRHALEDANAALALRPEWGKGYGRRGTALLGLGEWRQAEAAYREGLQVEPESASLLQGLEQAVHAAAAAELV